MLRTALLWASQNKALAKRLPNYRFARKAVRRFMPGEAVEDALRATAELNREGISTVLGRLGENITDLADATDVRNHYLDVLHTMDAGGLDTTLTVKPTQMGLDISESECTANTLEVVRQASTSGRVVWIDMEYSRYVEPTIRLFENLRQSHANVGICLQAYLHRTPSDLDKLLKISTAIRLVKGAYREAPEVAIQSRKDVDHAYMQLATRLLEESATGREVGAPPAFATHDIRILNRITTIARDRNIPSDAFEVQMLYGIQREEQLRLARNGYKARVLISYGTAWFPWYMRRLAERPANVWFLVKNLF